MTSAFHVAPTGARPAIAKLGLVANAPRPRWARYGLVEQPGGVYFWDSLTRAMRWASDFHRLVRNELGVCDVWHVDLQGLEVQVDPVLGDQGAVYVACDVGPERLSLRLGARCA